MVITAIKVAIVLLVIIVGVLLLQRRRTLAVHPAERAVGGAARDRPGAAAAAVVHRRRAVLFGVLRRARRRVAGVLRLHRLRRRRHRRRGDQAPEAGPAARHLRVAGRSSPCCTCGHHRADRHAALHRSLRTGPNGERPHLATAFAAIGVDWAANVIAIGALAGLTTVVLVLMLGQSRIIFAMAGTGCCRGPGQTGPEAAPRPGLTDRRGGVAVIAGFPTSACSRRWSTSARCSPSCWSPSGSSCCADPAGPGAVSYALHAGGADPVGCGLPVADDQPDRFTWVRFGIWMALGVAVYLVYGRNHSVQGRRKREGSVS